MSNSEAVQAFEQDLANGLKSLTCAIEGIRCGGCAVKIERHISDIDGISIVRANATTKRLRLIWDPARVQAKDILDEVSKLGFSTYPYLQEKQSEREDSLLIPLAIAGFGTMNIMAFSFAVWAGFTSDMGENTRHLMHWLSAAIAIPTCLYAGNVFYLPAISSLRSGRMTMDIPISLAVLTTLIASIYELTAGAQHVYFDAAVSLIFFLLIGRALEQILKRRSASASDNLRSLQQSHVQRIKSDGDVEYIQAQDLAAGDIIVIPTGEQVLADGVLISDSTEIDESITNGETAPETVRKGDFVLAGSIVVGRAVQIEVTASGEQSYLGEISNLIETAEMHKGKYAYLADKFAEGYGPLVLGASALGFLFWYFVLGSELSESLMIAVAVLIVTCPCAAGLATPAVIVQAVNKLLSHGIIVKNGEVLERLCEVDLVVIDKTGTLTEAVLELAPQSYQEDMLKHAAAMAGNSSHPLAKALCRAYTVQPEEGVRESPGKGLVASDGTRLGSADFVGEAEEKHNSPELWYKKQDEEPVCFSFQDIPKTEVSDFLSALQQQGLKISLLSGDKRRAVEHFANQFNIKDWTGEMRPEQKQDYINKKVLEGSRVLMIGDGLNDAPSLAASYVSVSPATAVQVSQSASDMVLAGKNLMPVVDAIRVAGTSQKLIKQNLMFSTIYNVVTLPIALAGGLTPLIAAILMSSSSLLVMLNALRLRR